MAAESSSPWGSLPPWLIAAIAVGSAVFFGTQKPDRPDTSKPSGYEAKAESAEKQAEGDEAKRNPVLTVLRDYFKVEPPKSNGDPDKGYSVQAEGGKLLIKELKTAQAENHELEDLLARHPKVSFDFLIATVPDPIDSKFVWEFDAAVRAIQRAMEARGFILHTASLPWPRKGSGSDAARAAAKTIYRQYPGAMLFRQGVEHERPVLILVLLIGETPISGIHKPAFTRALEYHDELNGLLWRPGLGVDQRPDWANESVWFRKRMIPVVGPYFSGSLLSLTQVLEDPELKKKQPTMKFQVISGSATGLGEAKQFGEGSESGEFGTLQTTVIPNLVVTRALMAYLRRERGPRVADKLILPDERVAFLYETNTTFGTEYEKFIKGQKDKITEQILDAIFLPFPSSISQLKENSAARASPLALTVTETSPLTPNGLPALDASEPRLQRPTQANGINPYDRDAAAYVAAEGIRGITRAIDRAGVRYVGIVASDSRDVVFLNQKVRMACPDVRVFTTEPSIAFTHPDDALYLRGMVVGSTYPIYQSADGWSAQSWAKTDRRIAFPNQHSQGIHNAVLAHYPNDGKYMLGYSPPTFSGDLQQASHLPPVWVSVVGEGGVLMPVHRYDLNPADPDLNLLWRDTPCPPLPSITAPPPTFSAAPVVTVPLTFLISQIIALVLLIIANQTLASQDLWRRWLGGQVHPSYVWFWRVVLLLGILMYAVPYTLPLRELVCWRRCCRIPSCDFLRAWRHWLALGLGGLILLACLSLALRATFRIVDPHASEPRRDGQLAVGYCVLLGTILGVLLVTWVWWGFQDAVQRFFLYVRVSDASAGLSPLIPMALVAAAAMLVAWYSLRQSDVASRAWLSCPYKETPWTTVETSESALTTQCQAFFLARLGASEVRLLLLLGVPFLLVTIWNGIFIQLPTAESWLWDNIMRWVFWATMAAIVGTLVRYLILWLNLRDLLRAVVQVPMVGAFERLPDEIGRRFRGYLHGEATREEHYAALAWALPSEDRRKLAYAINRNRPALGYLFGHGVGDPKDEDYQWLANELARLACLYLTDLPSDLGWQRQSVDRAFGVTTVEEIPADKKKPAKADDDAALKEKEEFVAAYVIVWLGKYFVQLRQLVYAMAFSIPCLLLAAACYPFQPDRPGMNLVAGLLGVTALGILYVLYEINRDILVSKISQTTPGRFTPDLSFLTSVLSFVAPILLFVAAHVFGLFRFVLEPILSMFQ